MSEPEGGAEEGDSVPDVVVGRKRFLRKRGGRCKGGDGGGGVAGSGVRFGVK